MSTLDLTHTCDVCGAEESLDVLLKRLIGDDDVRELLCDVIAMCLPLGFDVVRYLRLHKPATQRLRVATARKVLAELVPDLLRATLERNGRVWTTSQAAWRDAFQAVFAADEAGRLVTPLAGNGYLYSTLMRQLERQAATAEESVERARRHRAADGGAPSVDELAEGVMSPDAIAAQIGQQAEPAAPVDPDAAARAAAIKAQLRTTLAAKRGHATANETNLNEGTK